MWIVGLLPPGSHSSVPASIKVTFHSFSDIRTSGSYTAPDRSLLPHGKVQSSDTSLFKFRKWWEIRDGKTLRKPYDIQDVVTTPPMVGSTWLRVRSTLESDCLPMLSQGTALLCLVVDLLIIIFIVATCIRCLVIEVVLVHLIDHFMFSFSYMRPWGLFSDQLSGLLTWYLVSHDGLPSA